MSVDVTVNLTPDPAIEVSTTAPAAVAVSTTAPAAVSVNLTTPPAVNVDLTPPAAIAVRVGDGVPAGGAAGEVLTKASGTDYDVEWSAAGGGGSGTVTSVSVTTANGVSGTVATATTTPAISLTLGNITPTSVAASGTVTGSNLSGTNTGDQTSVSGNAGTATALQTARTINGVSFDGTSNITVTAAAGTLTGSTLAAGVTASSLTSVGTIATGVWQGTAVADSYIASAATWNAKQSAITFGTGVQTALGVNIGSAGAPVLYNGAGGTPSSIVLTNATGTASGLTAGNVTTNANLTGVITSVGNATSIASQTGTGTKFVVDNGPTLIAPVLGAATATTINKVTITAPATGSTLTIADGKTLTASNTLTLTATDGSTLAIGGGGTLGTAAYTAASAYEPALGNPAANGYVLSSTTGGTRSWVAAGVGDALTSGTLAQFAATTSAQLRGVISDETGSGSLVFATQPTLVGLYCTSYLQVSGSNGKLQLVDISAVGQSDLYTDNGVFTIKDVSTNTILQLDNTNGLIVPYVKPTNVITSGYGGTGNGFTKFTGPTTSEKTFTLPNSSETLLYSGGELGTPASGNLSNCTGVPKPKGLSSATTSSNTIADVANASFNIAASETRYFVFHLFGKCSGGGGTKWAINAPSGATVEFFTFSITTSMLNTGGERSTSLNTLGTAFNTGTNVDAHTIIYGRCVNSTNAGSVALRWASGTNTQTSTLYSGSSFYHHL